MATTQPPLDPRKYPWHYGDLVTSSFKKSGFVVDATPAYLEVVWMPECVTERLEPLDADNLLRLGHAASLSPTGDKTNIEVLETMLALHGIEIAIKKRIASCTTKTEEESIGLLIQRSFNKEGCEWDRAHSAQLFQLAVEPSNVGLLFKIQEKMHRISCKRH